MNYSVLALSNNTGTRHILSRLRSRFNKIYKQRVFVHHYTQFMDIEHFDTALENCTSVIKSYEELEKSYYEAPSVQSNDINSVRYKPII